MSKGQCDKSCWKRISEIVAAWDIIVSGPVEIICPETVFRLSSTCGGKFILKNIGDATSLTLRRLTFEYELLHHVQRAGLPVAVPLVDQQGRIAVPWGGHYYVLTPCLPNAEHRLQGEARRQLFYNYGVSIARMHQALATFPHHRLVGQVKRSILKAEVFDIGFPIILSYLEGEEAAHFRALLADLSTDMRTALQGLPEQLIHRDCHAENILTCGTEVTGIIDWDHPVIAPRILDLAYFAVQLAKRDVHNEDKMAQWFRDFPLLLQGYESECWLSEKERRAFPYMMIAIPILFAYWAIETGHDTAYIQTELEAIRWLYSNLEAIQERMQTI